MSGAFDRASLSWLPPASSGFRDQCKGLTVAADLGASVRRLASRQLDANQLSTLSKAIRRLRAEGARFDDALRPFRLALLGDGSQELIADALLATAPRHGVLLEVVDTPFNSIEAEVLDGDSLLYRSAPDAVLLNLTYRAFQHVSDGRFDDRDAAGEIVAEAIGRVRGVITAIRERSPATVILQTIARPPGTLFGSIERRLPGTSTAIIDAINRGLIDLASSPEVLLDTAALAETVGLDNWHDPAQWHSFKLPFSQRLVPLYADHVARTIAALCGFSRKCLVLDLDNTLWGGVIGDDGLDGIRLGQGLADGEAFLEVQRTAKRLRQRGVVLAVCSKNDDAVARAAFREHPDMLLAESDITVFQANWSDKPANLEAIARELGIGIDALVLLDDNAAERELVRQRLPQVAVPELPDDPALYSAALMASGHFETAAYSAEDSLRAEGYAARAKVAELRVGAADLGDFLESLEMVLTFAPFDGVNRSRISQLINKSNQFNLTTRRYTEAEVQRIEHDPALFTLQVRLKDKLADHGMIGVVICRLTGARAWEIDTWLMSCRVLGRRVEEAVLTEIVQHAARQGITGLIGRYIASGRNAMVAAHYRALGFSAMSESPMESSWSLKVAGFLPPALPFDVRRPTGA